MKALAAILFLLSCTSCNSLRNMAEEDRVSVMQRSAVQQGKPLSSLLIVGTGDVISRQFIDGTMEAFQHRLWGEQIPTSYFFISSSDFSEAAVVKKMQEASADRYRYLLLVSQDGASQLAGRNPLVMLDLRVKLFEKDVEEPLWSSAINLSGRVYKEDVYTQASSLVFLHFKANNFLAKH